MIRNLRALTPFFAIVLAAAGMTLGLPAAASATPPFAGLTGAASKDASTAGLTGWVNAGNNPTSYYVEYDLMSSEWCASGGSAGSPTYASASADLVYTDDTNHDVEVDLNGLTEDVQYCARLVASSVEGDFVSGQVTWWQGQPEVETTGASVHGFSTATVEGQINPHHQSVEYTFGFGPANSTWCTSSGASGSPPNDSGGAVLTSDDNSVHNVSANVGPLAAGVEYCAALITSSGWGEKVVGTPVTWTQSMPDAITWDAYSTSATATTVEGQVNAAGDSSTTYDVEYDLASSQWCTSGGASGTPAYTTTAGSGGLDLTSTAYQDVSPTVGGLTAGQDYCGRIVASNDTGEAYGGQVWWTQGLPTTDTYTAAATGTTAATVTGDVNPAGQATTYQVDYDAGDSNWCQTGSGTSAHASAATSLPPDGAFHDVSVDLTGLTPGAYYCAAVVATNAAGTYESSPLFWSQPPPPEHTLTLTTSGPGRGDVTSSPSGIACGPGILAVSCSHDFAEGTQVTLTAFPAPDSTVAWVGAPGCASGATTCTVTMTADQNIGVVFNLQPIPSLAVLYVAVVDNQSTAQGAITSNPTGIDCGLGASSCSYVFPVGTQVTLTATPDKSLGAIFSGWSGGGCSGTGTCTVTISAGSSPTVTATFSPSEATPSCSLKPATNVALTGATAGLLPVGLTCDQSVTFSLSGGVTVEWYVWKKHKPHTKKWRRTIRFSAPLHTVTGSAQVGVAKTITFKLPARLLSALKQHRTAWGSASFEVDATNDNGAGVDTGNVKRFR